MGEQEPDQDDEFVGRSADLSRRLSSITQELRESREKAA